MVQVFFLVFIGFCCLVFFLADKRMLVVRARVKHNRLNERSNKQFLVHNYTRWVRCTEGSARGS